MFNSKKAVVPKVEFISLVPGLEGIDEVRPRPAIEFIPDWWKPLPKYNIAGDRDTATAKACPAFPHYFSSGYIIPMWQDTTFYYSPEIDRWGMRAGRESIADWSPHPRWQLLDHTTAQFRNQEPSFIFKATSPWNVVTPPGWSLLQLPLFYHFNSDFTVLPGIIDTDVHHQINQQVAYFGDSKEVHIKRGEPFAQYIPIQRQSLPLDVRSATPQDLAKINLSNLHLQTKETGSGEYRHMRTKNGN